MQKFKSVTKDRIAKLPKSSGVYVFRKGAKRGARLRREGGGRVGVLYIGKAANIRERVRNHFQQSAYRDNLFINQVKKIGYLKTNSEIEALVLEANLIKKYQPKYNVIWRDDKNYFFVAITKEDFPCIFWTHQTKLKPKSLPRIIPEGSVRGYHLRPIYVGPFVDGKALKQTLKILRKVFPYRTCKTLPKKPCLWYQLDRCPAPCLIKSKLASQLSNFQIKMKNECQRNARNLIKILQGKKKQVLKELKKEMKKASISQDFEKAAKIRDQIKALEKVLAHTKIFEPQLPPTINWPQIQKILQQTLKIKKRISRIEAYDISNIQGKLATGAMVTFIAGQPDKNFYRKFKIKIADKPDDIAMLKECLNRRFKHPEWPYPDLILIDGGRAQLNIALQYLTSGFKQIEVIALAKKRNELYIKNQKEPILLKNMSREIFNLILQLRDEAHRFAISYHKKLRVKDLLK